MVALHAMHGSADAFVSPLHSGGSDWEVIQVLEIDSSGRATVIMTL